MLLRAPLEGDFQHGRQRQDHLDREQGLLRGDQPPAARLHQDGWAEELALGWEIRLYSLWFAALFSLLTRTHTLSLSLRPSLRLSGVVKCVRWITENEFGSTGNDKRIVITDLRAGVAAGEIVESVKDLGWLPEPSLAVEFGSQICWVLSPGDLKIETG